MCGLKAVIKPQTLKRLGYIVIDRHKNTQEARQVGILGAERRATPPARLSAVVSTLLSHIAQHGGFQMLLVGLFVRRRRPHED
jgi:Holliday junction resolvasome RuvABC endonuclease subunit